MSVLIFANGEMSPGNWAEPYLESATVLIAANGGLRHIRSLGRMPDVVIGDLVSMGAATLGELKAADAKVIVYPENKNATDLQLALQYAVAQYDDDILIFGALGGRLDQLLANVLLLTAPVLQGRELRIIEEYQQTWIIDSSVCQFMGAPGDLVSLIPLCGDVHVNRSDGLRWPLRNEELVFGLSRGISNSMTDKTALVEVSSGILLCIHTKKEWQR